MTQKTFDQLKKNSNKLSQDLFSKMKQSQEKKTYNNEDNRFWKARQDAAGNGSATIRFLPSPDTEEPFVQIWSHGFQHNGKYFIENCPTTKGKACPCCEANKQLWDSGLDSDKEIARDRKRKLSYISNILVVNDPANPDNNGKVFLFKYGKKIHDKILDAMIPEDATEEPIDVFNMFEGVNFKLKIKKVSGFTNFDSSSFDQRITPICNGNEKEMKAVFESAYPLGEFIADDKFKSYAELDTKLNTVLGNVVNRRSTIEDSIQDEEEDDTEKQLEALIQRKLKNNQDNEEDDIPSFDSKEDVPFDVDEDDIDAQLKALIDED